MPIVFKVAESSEDKETVFKLRHRVFVEQERRFPHQTPYILDMFDSFDETLNIIAFKDAEPIGTIRVVMDSPAGFPADEHFDFRPFIKDLEGRCACFGWLCVLKEFRSYPGLLIGLFKMAVHSMRKMGARHVVATLHPPLMRLLQRAFNAKRLGNDFESPGLQVPMTPAFLSWDKIPPRSREIFDFSSEIILQDSNVRKIYQEGEIIAQKGEAGDDAFFILRGSIRVLPTDKNGNDIIPERNQFNRIGEKDFLISKGNIFGELSLLDGGARTTTIVPYSNEVDVMVWSKEMFMKQLEHSRDKALQICRLLGTRLRRQIQGYKNITAPSPSAVANVLLDASDEGTKPIHVTWLARQCGLWPENLREIITEWRKNEIVALEDENVRVLNPKLLTQYSS